MLARLRQLREGEWARWSPGTHPGSISHSTCEIAPEGIQILGYIVGGSGKAGGKVGVGAAFDGRVDGLLKDVLQAGGARAGRVGYGRSSSRRGRARGRTAVRFSIDSGRHWDGVVLAMGR